MDTIDGLLDDLLSQLIPVEKEDAQTTLFRDIWLDLYATMATHHRKHVESELQQLEKDQEFRISTLCRRAMHMTWVKFHHITNQKKGKPVPVALPESVCETYLNNPDALPFKTCEQCLYDYPIAAATDDTCPLCHGDGLIDHPVKICICGKPYQAAAGKCSSCRGEDAYSNQQQL